jgi:hypothetical protein
MMSGNHEHNEACTQRALDAVAVAVKALTAEFESPNTFEESEHCIGLVDDIADAVRQYYAWADMARFRHIAWGRIPDRG